MLRKWRTLIVFGSIFGVFFLLHIVLAANNYDTMFGLVATGITVMTFFCGPICMLLESSSQRYKSVFFQGMLASIPLSIGLGWAYNEMSVGYQIFLFPVFALIIHYLISKSRLGDTYGLK